MSTTSAGVLATSSTACAVAGLPHDLQVGLRVHEHRESGTDQLLVIDEDHADAHPNPHDGSGISARTTKPPVGVGAADIRSPSNPTRSPIPVSPRPGSPAMAGAASPGPFATLTPMPAGTNARSTRTDA